MKMILHMVVRLMQRGIHLSWFRHFAGATIIDSDQDGMYRGLKVCNACHDLYQTEMKLLEVEKEWSQLVGGPEADLSSGPAGASGEASEVVTKGFGKHVKGLVTETDLPAMPETWRWSLPIGEAVVVDNSDQER